MKVDNEHDIDGLSYVREGVIYIHSQNCRNMVQSALRRPNDAPGTIQFPTGIGQNQSGYFRHLVSKQDSIDPKTKKIIEIRGAGREDWLDCRIYNYALMIGFLQAKVMYQARLAAKTVKSIVKAQLETPMGEGADTSSPGKIAEEQAEAQKAVQPIHIAPNPDLVVNNPSQQASHHQVGPVRIGGHMRNPANGPGMNRGHQHNPNQGRRSSIGQNRRYGR
jgi:hypothetical protein